MISIIIPTYMEERNIGLTIKSIKKEMKKIGKKYEIIVVDKYSKDKTTKIAKRLGAKVLYDEFGKGSALIKGFNSAKGNVLISMDADLSNRAEELPLLIDAVENGFDACFGSRFILGGKTEDMPLLRKIGNKFFVMLVNLLYKTKYTDLCYGYRSFKKSAFKKLDLKEKGFGIETEMSIKAVKKGLKVIEIPSFEKKRLHGKSNLKTFKDGFVILKTILSSLFKDN